MKAIDLCFLFGVNSIYTGCVCLVVSSPLDHGRLTAVKPTSALAQGGGSRWEAEQIADEKSWEAKGN